MPTAPIFDLGDRVVNLNAPNPTQKLRLSALGHDENSTLEVIVGRVHPSDREELPPPPILRHHYDITPVPIDNGYFIADFNIPPNTDAGTYYVKATYSCGGRQYVGGGVFAISLVYT